MVGNAHLADCDGAENAEFADGNRTENFVISPPPMRPTIKSSTRRQMISPPSAKTPQYVANAGVEDQLVYQKGQGSWEVHPRYRKTVYGRDECPIPPRGALSVAASQTSQAGWMRMATTT